MSEEKNILLLCRQCRAPKVHGRRHCCYCVGRDAVKHCSFRMRMLYKLFSSYWKRWFVFYLGYEKRYDVQIPEHLREGDWVTIHEINNPNRMDGGMTCLEEENRIVNTNGKH